MCLWNQSPILRSKQCSTQPDPDQINPCYAVPRGLALAWFVFRGRAVWWLYAAAIGADWAFCVLSMFVLRRVKDLPKACKAAACSVLIRAVMVLGALLFSHGVQLHTKHGIV